MVAELALRNTSKGEDIELVYVKIVTREEAKIKDKKKEQPMLRSAKYKANKQSIMRRTKQCRG